MAHNQQQSEHTRQKKLAKRKQQRIDKHSQSRSLFNVPPKIEKALREASVFYEEKRFKLALDRLSKLDAVGQNHPYVLEMMIAVNSSLGDALSVFYFAKKSLAVQPKSRRTMFHCGQAALMAGMVNQASMLFNRYLTCWPNGEQADEVKTYLIMVEEQRLKRILTVDLPTDDADVVLQLHEDSLLEMAQSHFEESVSLCQSVISKAPTFVAAYNNMATALWQLGECDRAANVLEQAIAIPNCNAFTKALLAKYSLTAGKLDAANRLADQLIDVPLGYEDAALPICELLAMLGRDEDLLKFVVDNSSLQEKSCDEFHKSGWLHYQAYANCRLGNISEAKRLWTASTKCDSVYPGAKENLNQLQKGNENAPSATLITSWIPSRVENAFRKACKDIEQDSDSFSTFFTSVMPQMFHLMPYLLDRGDSYARELALLFAKMTKTPESLKHLKTFAIGKWGSDSDRMSALTFLGQQSAMNSSPIPFYSKGSWTEVVLFSSIITDEPIRAAKDPVVAELSERGHELQQAGRLDECEEIYNKILQIDPHDYVIIHNRCFVWMMRDGASGRRRAKPVLEKLLVDFPDYNFAKLSIAGLIYDVDVERAKSLCHAVLASPKLHTTEAHALFRIQLNIAARERNYPAAQTAYQMLTSIFSNDQSKRAEIRDEIFNRYGLRAMQLIVGTN